MANAHKTILVIEDEVALSKPLQDNLTREGFRVTVASDGESGLSFAASLQPDLILLNLLLPKIDGMTVLRTIRKENAWGRKVPVVILTNLTSRDEERIRDVIELEPTYYFEKVERNIEEVVEKVKELLAEKGKPAKSLPDA